VLKRSDIESSRVSEESARSPADENYRKETSKMTNRRISLFSFIAVACFALLFPVLASAQTSQGPWWRRDRDRDDRWGRGNDYNRRVLRAAARRLEDRSQSFQRHLDDRLDDSRYDDTRREDNLNQLARDLRVAADRFEDRVDDRGDLNRGAGEARQLLSIAARINRQLTRVRLDARTSSDWAQIRNDLRTIADIYGLRLNDFDPVGRGRRWPY
jgi:hypothetical protein